MILTDEPQIRVILLDVEGTTTPIDFVTKTLFPYASRKLETFLHEHFGELEIHLIVRDLRAQNRLDEQAGLRPPLWIEEPAESRLNSAVAYGQWLIAHDSKCTPLKTLQGKIWQQGYATGELRGEVYDDVPRAFVRWHGQRRTICIYSSGSELAQRLLFSTVASGDLMPYIAGFFDTRVGAKAERESYNKIASAVGHEANEMLFISDAVKEVEAARGAGMHGALCVRDADASPVVQQVIRSFDDVFP